jgi:primase-polymerase (primpol)-like protein
MPESGDGVHSLAFGTLPEGGRRRGNHEMYDDKRFFVVTGRKLQSSPECVAHREDELRQLHAMIFGTVGKNQVSVKNQADGCPKTCTITQRGRGGGISDEAVIERLEKDPVAKKYWNGCPHNVNPSKADFALACKLAFYCRRNLAQMERLFRRSALATRPKAGTRRGNLDYVSHTLQSALSKQAAVWQPKRRARSLNPPGRPRCRVDAQEVVNLKSAGKSWRTIAGTLSIGTATAIRLFNRQVEVAGPVMCCDPTGRETGISRAEGQAPQLNRPLQEQGVNAEPGRIAEAVTK